MFDVAIIGAGIVGAMTARLLSKYNLSVCVIEKDNDVATGSTRANSAIVHAGFDAKVGSLKAKLNVKGSEMMAEICKDLGVKYKNNGSLVIGFDEEDEKTIKDLYIRGTENGVKNLEILDACQLQKLEPNISKNATSALYAPTGAIVCPYELAIAAMGNAIDNDVEFFRNSEVIGIEKTQNGYSINTKYNEIECKYIVNAAGLYSDKIAKMVGDNSFDVHPRRGEYILLDKSNGDVVSHTIFRTPTKAGKGILVSPTVDGNLLLGPTSVDMEDKTDRRTTVDGLSLIIKEALENADNIRLNNTITSFCGLRAVGSTGDFIINEKDGFINAAGIESPGLTASPAIALYILDLLKNAGLNLSEKSNYKKTRKSMTYFRDCTTAEKNEIIKNDKTFGKIVCRCEQVTEGEILEAIRTNPKPWDLDGVKRRTRAQMGRCQGGFCSPHIIELLSKELNIPYEEITKFGGESVITYGKTKGVK